MKLIKNKILPYWLYGASVLLLLTGAMSCSKDKHQAQAQSQTDELSVKLSRRAYNGSYLSLRRTMDFGKTEADNSIRVCNIAARIKTLGVYHPSSSLDVFVPNPDNQTISGTVDVTVGGKTLHAPYTIKPLFNKNDIDQVKAFFSAKSHGSENIAILNLRNKTTYDLNTMPSSWHGVGIEFSAPPKGSKELYSETDHDRRLIVFNEPFPVLPITTKFYGSLVLRGCSHLKKVFVSDEQFTSIDLTGADPDLLLECDKNDLTSITLSHPLKDNTKINPQRPGPLTTTDGLHYTP